MLLSDGEIRNLAYSHRMIEPFSEPRAGGGIISFGLTSAGYDLRLAPEVWIFNPYRGELIDPKRFADPVYKESMFYLAPIMNDTFILPANCYCLGRSYEYLRIPRHLKARCVGKSTLARSGILINTTPLEPEWEGHLTIEIGNVTSCPAKVYVMEGIAQLEFEVLSSSPETSYKDKGGQYQSQTGVTPARVKA